MSSTRRLRLGTVCAAACALVICSSCLAVARVAARRAATPRKGRLDVDELAKLIDRRRRDGERAPVPAEQALVLQPGDGLAYRCGAYSKFFGQTSFGQLLARRERPVGHALPQRRVGLVRQGTGQC
jgi:hypothetical protein